MFTIGEMIMKDQNNPRSAMPPWVPPIGSGSGSSDDEDDE